MSTLRTVAAMTLAAGVATVSVAILAMTTSSARLTSLATSTAVLTVVCAVALARLRRR
jgi:hypothetical protein